MRTKPTHPRANRRTLRAKLSLMGALLAAVLTLQGVLDDVPAAEAAVGLAIIIASFRNRTTVNVDELALLRG